MAKIQRTRNYGLTRKTQPWLYGPIIDNWAALSRQLTSESIREDQYQKWFSVLAFLYVELGLDAAEYYANWGV